MKELGRVIFYLVVGACAFVWLVKVPILSYYATKELKVPVFIEWISVWPSEIKIHGLKIEGPSEERSAFLLKAEEVLCRCRFKNWFLDPIVIEDLLLDTVVVNITSLHTNPSQTNWEALETKIAPSRNLKPVIVDRCILTNITIITRDSLGKERYSKVDRLEFVGLDSKHGFPTARILEKIRSSQ